MADTQSSLPIRTIAPGDALVGVLDSTETRINPAKEDGNLATIAAVDFATETTLGTIKTDTASLAAEDFATEATLATIKTDTASLAAEDFATETTLATIKTDTASLAAEDFATETTLLTVKTDTGVIAGDTTSIDAKLPAVLGQTNSAGSLSVTMASDQSPMPVYVTTSIPSAPVVDFKTDAAVIPTGTSTHTYSPATKFVLNNVQASGSGRIKVEVKIGLTGAETLRWVGFNSTSMPNVFFDASDYSIPGVDTTGWSVVVVVTNLEVGKNQDLYSTIVGNL